MCQERLRRACEARHVHFRCMASVTLTVIHAAFCDKCERLRAEPASPRSPSGCSLRKWKLTFLYSYPTSSLHQKREARAVCMF